MFKIRKTVSNQKLLLVQRKNKLIKIRINEVKDFVFLDGDEIKLMDDAESITTPDGCINFRDEYGRAYRLPKIWVNSYFNNFKLPEHLVLLTGAGTETLDTIGKAHISNYQQFMGLKDSMSIVEIGSGIGRDAFQLLNLYSDLNFLGIDVTRDSIEWCNNNISKINSGYKFVHFDAYHELYNPLGSKKSQDFKIPVPDKSVDRIFLGSVFTHLFEDEVRHYMREISRILKNDGLAYATFFLYSDEIIAEARKTRRSHNGLTFEYEHSIGCYVSDPNFHTGSVAYTEILMNAMIEESNLELARDFLKGWWSGYYQNADDGQEVAILRPSLR
jgi:SAM-dependent methyltransferase